jgi:hypothetical protein
MVTPPRRAEPDTTVKEVAPDVIVPVSVDCCEREEYWRVVIQVPIECSERVVGIELADALSLQQVVGCIKRKVVW